MSIIKNLLNSFFGEKNTPKKEVKRTSSFQDYLKKAEEERLAKVAKTELEIKYWLVELIRQVNTINFKWDSGNDEGFVYFENVFLEEIVDDKEFRKETLEEYLIDVLNIPCAGDFSMTGKGMLFIVNNIVMAKYESTLKNIVDYDEETDEEIHGEIEEEDKEIILFKL